MKKATFYCLIVCFVLSVTGTKAQNDQNIVPDTTQTATISIVDVSAMSYQSIQKARQLSNRLVSNEKLGQLQTLNDSLVSLLDSLFGSVILENLVDHRRRRLEEKILFWKRIQNELSSHITEVSSVLHRLEDNKLTLERELLEWEEIDSQLKQDELYETAEKRISAVFSAVNNVVDTIRQKREKIVNMLDQSMSLDLRISEEIDTYRARIKKKQEELFASSQPSFIDIGFFDAENWKSSESLGDYYEAEYEDLKTYLRLHLSNVFLHLIFIIILIFLFRYLKRKGMEIIKKEAGDVYKQRFLMILSHPVHMALIIGLSVSGRFYPNMPIIWDDILTLLAIIPIIVVLSSIIVKRFHIYLYAFGFVLLWQLLYINLPEYNLVSSCVLLLIGAVQAVAFFYLFRYIRRREFKLKKYILLFRIIIAAQFIGAIVSIGALILGKVFLAEYLLFSVISNFFAAIIILLVVVVLNGLTVIIIQSKFASKINSVKNNRGLLIRKLTGLFNLIAVIFFVFYMLRVLGLDVGFYNSILEWLGEERNLFNTEFSWGNILAFVIVIWLSVLISRIVQTLLEKDILSTLNFGKGLSYTIALMIKYAIVTAGVFLAADAAGIPFSQLTIIFGAFSVGIGFGLQNIFNNLVSGLILLFERPLKVEDVVEVGTLLGRVKSIGIRASRVRTFDGAEIIVPNGNFISKEVVNWTLSDQKRRIEVIVGVAYDSDPHKVHDILLEVLKQHEDIADDPVPEVYIRDFGESSIDFRMLAWTPNFNNWIRIRSDIHFGVFDELKKAGIVIPFPQRDIHVRSGLDSAPAGQTDDK